AHQQFQRVDLTRREGYSGIVDGRLAQSDVEMQIANTERGAKRPPRPSQEGAQASRQFLHGKRLENIVVGACVQARDPIINAVARGQDEDWRAVVSTTQFPQNVDPVTIR